MKMTNQKLNKPANTLTLPLQTRLATLELGDTTAAAPTLSENVNTDTTFNVVFSTGATVRRCDVFNDCYYDEQLVIEPTAIRTERLNSGAPVLDTHADASLSNIIGVVVPGSVKIAGGIARASIKLDTGAENQSTIRKIKDGIIRNISVGYVVHRFEVICEDDDSVPLYRATEWEPFEISLVPIGADSGAGIRASPHTYPCLIVRANDAHTTNNSNTNPNFNLNPKETTMTNITTQEEQLITSAQTEAESFEEPEAITANIAGAVINDDESPPVVQTNSSTHSVEDGIKRERSRVLEIQKIVRAAKLSSSVEAQLISSGTSVNQARKIVLDQMAKDSSNTGEIRSIRVSYDRLPQMAAAIENAILNKYDSKFTLSSDASEFRCLRLTEIGRKFLEHKGINTRNMSPIALVDTMLDLRTRGGYMSTDDFPGILSNVVNKTLRDAYAAQPQTFKPFCRRVTLPDFKFVTRVQLGDAPTLERVGEGGEFKRGSLSESKEQYQLITHGKVISITRQAIINDDLSAFTRNPALFGAAAANVENDLVWSIITDNAQMSDKIELFHAKHHNLAATGATISIQSLSQAREALRKQQGLSGRAMNITAKYLLVPCSLETVAQQMLGTNMLAARNQDINPFAGSLTIITDPSLDRASTTAWYLSAEPTRIDTIEYAYLEGNEGVYLESRIGYDVDGIELKARLDFGAKAIDHRGFYRNPGQA